MAGYEAQMQPLCYAVPPIFSLPYWKAISRKVVMRFPKDNYFSQTDQIESAFFFRENYGVWQLNIESRVRMLQQGYQ